MHHDSPPALAINKLYVAYHTRCVLESITVTIPHGVMVALAGPNGAGKSTLLQSLIGLIPVQSGTISMLGGSFNTHRLKIGYIPQRTSLDWDFPAYAIDIALMGRYGHRGWFKRTTAQDRAQAYHALELVGMQSYAHTPIGSLSGGQQQRVLLARALAQQAQLYIMDEPFVGVDMATEESLMIILQQLKSAGKTILIVHHDLQTIRDYFDWAWLLNVRSVACGPTAQVLTKQHIQATYGKVPTCVPFE